MKYDPCRGGWYRQFQREREEKQMIFSTMIWVVNELIKQKKNKTLILKYIKIIQWFNLWSNAGP